MGRKYNGLTAVLSMKQAIKFILIAGIGFLKQAQ